MKRNLKKLAKERAALHGGAIICRGETRAYQAGHREGWWTQGRGVNNGDCVSIYVARHWREFVSRVRRAHGQPEDRT